MTNRNFIISHETDFFFLQKEQKKTPYGWYSRTIIHDSIEYACADSRISMLAMLTYDSDARTT